MKKILFILIVLLTSCNEDIWININTTGTPSSLIVNIGDSNYGTRAVVEDNAVKADLIKNTEIALHEGNTWTNYTTMSDTVQFIEIGTDRGYVYAEADLSNPYDWKVNHSINNGELTLTAIQDDVYYKPIPVTFWGNYGLACFNEYQTSYTEGRVGDDTKVTDLTKTVAIDHNIQYATSVFKPTIEVADNITVYSSYTGKRTKTISKDDFKFSILYIYVQSAESVTYSENFNYKPSNNLVTYCYALPNNGIFGKTENGIDIFDNWASNYANLSILPTSSTSVKVVLVCYFMGTKGGYLYNKTKKHYELVTKGTTFYITGTLNTDANHSVTNPGNSLCPTNGSAGIFIPDVKTLSTITISSLVKDTDGNGENDPVIIDASTTDVTNYNGLFNIDVEYGNMNADWEF